MSAAPDQELRDLRAQIDAIDAELLQLLAKRMATIRIVGHYKHQHGLPPLDQQRWEAVRASILSQANRLKLPEDFVTRLFELVHEYTLLLEAEIADNA